MQTKNDTPKPDHSPQQEGGEGCPAATCSGFFIVNTYDKPTEEHIAEKRPDGKFYYVHPRLKNVRQYWGMRPENPTPIEDFGISVMSLNGRLYGEADERYAVKATYSDGHPREWQGAKSFEFCFQNA